ncbi:MAG: tetratricopeptide repeat protein, partial [bacterium]|nr:tetratricopeptide repeat protein [bacterium]
GAEDWAIKSYEEAEKLQPANPLIPTQKGITYIGKALVLSQVGGKEIEKNEALKQALEALKRAIALKPDYAPAHFQTAVVYQLEGKVADVITKLEETKAVAPFDVGLAFQLGVIYYQNGNYDKAKGELQRAILMNPDYSNARYFLGLIFDREKNKALAIEQFQKIEELNPGNEEVQKILANLKAGDSALKGIVPAVPPATPISEEKP